MKYITRKELFETDGITVFTYNLNLRAVKMFEFGSLCLLVVAAFIYPMTHFEPREWMVVPILLAIAAIAAYATSQRWRYFIKNEYLGWDETNLYVTQGSKGCAVIPWNALTLENSGLKDPNSGSVINIHLPNEPLIQLRLVTGFVIVSNFQNVLAAILLHIKQNMENNGEIPKSDSKTPVTDNSNNDELKVIEKVDAQSDVQSETLKSESSSDSSTKD